MKIRATASVGNGKKTSVIDIDDEELEDMTPEERQRKLSDIAHEWAMDIVESDFEEIPA